MASAGVRLLRSQATSQGTRAPSAKAHQLALAFVSPLGSENHVHHALVPVPWLLGRKRLVLQHALQAFRVVGKGGREG